MKNTTIISGILSGIFVLCTLGGSWYGLSSIRDMRVKLSATLLDLQKEEDKARMILDVKNQLKRLEGERTKLGQYFFKEEEIVRLLEQLEDLARHADVEMTVASASIADRDQKKVFQIGIKIDGSWQHTVYFIKLLESLPFRLQLTHMSLSNMESGEQWAGNLSVDLLSFIPKKTAP
jgi:Tfp pilus assembly protein PilO